MSEIEGRTSLLRNDLARIEAFPHAAAVVERALPAEAEDDFEEVRGWRVQIEHENCSIWLITDVMFVCVTLHTGGAYDIETIPVRNVRQIIENCRDGVIGVTIEVEAGPTNYAGETLPDGGVGGTSMLARSSRFQYVAVEQLADPVAEAPLQFFARAVRVALSAAY